MERRQHPGYVAQQAYDKDWSAHLPMYMLAPGTSGNTTVRGMNVDLNVSFGEISCNLQFGGIACNTVHYRHSAVSKNVIYMGLGAAQKGFDLGFNRWMVEPVVQYQGTPRLSLYASARYISVKGTFPGPPGCCTGTGLQSGWGPVVGADMASPLKGKIRLPCTETLAGLAQASPSADRSNRCWTGVLELKSPFSSAAGGVLRLRDQDGRRPFPLRLPDSGTANRRNVPFLMPDFAQHGGYEDVQHSWQTLERRIE